jgi:hypothetical protein
VTPQDDPYLRAMRAVEAEKDDPYLRAMRAVEAEQPSGLWPSAVRAGKDFARQAARGAGESITSLGEVADFFGADALAEQARRGDTQLQETFGDAEGGFGTAGRFAGRIAGEIGQAVAMGGGILKGATKIAARKGVGSAAAQKVVQGLSSQQALTRALSTAAASAPIDVLQGLKAEDGFLLPGKAGSVAENVLMSGAAGAIPWQRIFGRAAEATSGPITDPARMLPPSTTQAAEEFIPGPGVTTPPVTEAVVDGVIQPATRPWSREGTPRTFAMPEVPPGPVLGPDPAWQGPLQPWQGPLEAAQGQARGALPGPRPEGPPIPMGPAGSTSPQHGQVRALLTGSSTESVPRAIPASGAYPAMRLSGGEAVRTPLTARADVLQNQPAIPMGAPKEDLFTQAAKQVDEAPPPATVRQADDATPAAARQVDELDEVARAEREALAAVDRPSAWDVELDALEARLKPLPRGKKAFEALSDDDLFDHAVYRTRLAEEATGAEAMLEEVTRVLEMNATGRALGLKKAKELYGGDIAEIGRLARFTEEQIEALRDMGLEATDVLRLRAVANRGNKGANILRRIDDEMQRRGLSLGRDADAISFDPSDFMDRSGFARTEVLSTLAGGGLGAAAGAAGAAPGDRGAGAVMGGALGAGLGAGAGRLAARGLRSATTATRGASAATPGAPVTAVDAAQSVPDASAAKTPEQASRARDRINRPASPTPPDAIYRPRTNDEWRAFYERFLKNPDEIAEADALRRSGQAQAQQGTRRIGDDLTLAQAIAETDGGLALKDARRKLSGPELLALRAQRAANAERRIALRAKLNDPATSAADKVWMDDLLIKLEDQSIAQFERYTRDVSQTGRDLRLLREAVKLSDDPADWLLRAERLAGGKPIAPETWAELMGHIKTRNWAKAESTLSKVMQSTFLDRAGELWQTGLLTGFMRPVRDIISNNLNLVDKQVERAVATFFDTILGLRTGTRTAAYSLPASWKATKEGWKRGAEAIEAIFKEQGDPKLMAEVMQRYDFSRQTLQKNPILRAYTTFVRKTIGAADALTRLAATDVALVEQARVFARQTAKPGTKEFDTLVQQYLKQPPAEMLGLAMAQADEVTWQNSTSLGRGAAALAQRNAQSALARFLGKLTVPFSQTPSAMTTQTAKGTPLGLLGAPKDIYQIARKMNLPVAQRRLVNRLAKVSVGSGWIALGYWLADNDKMTSFYPSEDRERRRWELEGRTEVAMKVGGTWVSLLGMLGPQAQLMALGSALRKLTDEDPDWTLGAAGLTLGTGIARAAGDSPMLQGVSTIADLAGQAGRGDADAMGESLNQAAQTFVTGWVPQAVQQVARASDLTDDGKVRVRQVREPGRPVQTAVNAVAQGIPGTRQLVPVRKDALGQERATSVGGLAGVLSPARLSRETQDPNAQELWRTNAAVARTPRRKGESLEAYEARVEALGAATKRAVEAVRQSEGYQQLDQMDAGALRERLRVLADRGEVQAEQVQRLDALSDDQVRDRLRGVLLERAIGNARRGASQRFPDPGRGAAGTLLQRLTR